MTWLDRQSFLGTDSDAVLAGMTVGIVGLGGGGSHVVQQLAHIGIGRFVIVDDDRISLSNLNRLVGARRVDVCLKRRKVDIAKRGVLSINPRATVVAVPQRWQDAASQLALCDVVFGCVDNVRSKDELEAYCRRLLIPFIDQGMDVHEIVDGYLISGQVLLSMPGHPCLRCYGIVTDGELEAEGRNYGAAGGKPQVVWPNGVLASSAAGLFMQLATAWHRDALASVCLEYDGNRHTVIHSDRARRLGVRTCPHYDEADLGDPAFDVRNPPATDGHGKAPPPRRLWRRLSLRWAGFRKQ